MVRSDGVGIYVGGGASLYSYAGTTVTDNHMVGIQASDGARVYLGAGTTVADHQVFGISVFSTASVYLYGATITATQQTGLYVAYTSFAFIYGGTFSENGYLDISCNGPPPGVVVGIESAGTVKMDCVQPALAPNKMPKAVPIPPGPSLPPRT